MAWYSLDLPTLSKAIKKYFGGSSPKSKIEALVSLLSLVYKFNFSNKSFLFLTCLAKGNLFLRYVYEINNYFII